MKNTESKISAPQTIEDFTKDVLQYAKEKANKEELDFIKSQIKEMIKGLEEGVGHSK